jgi:dephospho-CoA kinase
MKKVKRIRLYNSPLPLIGLTGGIATGKTSVRKLLKERGQLVLCSDEMVKNIYESAEVKKIIARLYPSAYDSTEEKIIFPLLREIFYKDLEEKKKIEGLIHPRLNHEFHRQLKSLSLSFGSPPPQYIILDQSVLFEKAWHLGCDETVLVYCEKQTQLKRLMARDHLSIEMAQSIINQQVPLDLKKAEVGFCVDNNGSLEDLGDQVDLLLNWIRSRM